MKRNQGRSSLDGHVKKECSKAEIQAASQMSQNCIKGLKKSNPQWLLEARTNV